MAAGFARGLALVLLSAWVSVAAAAEEWKQIDRNDRDDSLWVDLKSIRRVGSRVTYAERIDFGTARAFSDGSKLKSIWGLYTVDCAQKTRAQLNVRGVSPTGQAIGVSDLPKEPIFKANDTNPKSPDAMTLKFVCEFRGAENP